MKKKKKTSVIDCVKGLVAEMTYYVSSRTLNSTQSLTSDAYTRSLMYVWRCLSCLSSVKRVKPRCPNLGHIIAVDASQRCVCIGESVEWWINDSLPSRRSITLTNAFSVRRTHLRFALIVHLVQLPGNKRSLIFFDRFFRCICYYCRKHV